MGLPKCRPVLDLQVCILAGYQSPRFPVAVPRDNLDLEKVAKLLLVIEA